MSSGITGSKIDLIESSGADLPPAGTTRIIRVGGVTQQSVDGAPFAGLGGGQDPANVAITGGSITGVNTATRTVQGAMSPTDKAFSDDFDGWQKTQYATMIAAVPALTGFAFAKIGLSPMELTTGALADDANVEGGGMKNGSVSSKVYGASIFQNTAGGNWAIAGRLKMPPPGAGVNSQFGVQNATGGHSLMVGSTNAIDATHWYGQIFTAAGSHTDVIFATVADSNFHDFAITDNGTTVRWWIDGVQVGSTTTRTNLTTEPMQIYTFGTATGPPSLLQVMYGYVRP
jgi:hypothetical protein